MPNPLFGIPAACRLNTSEGSSTKHLYDALVEQYHFGTPVIHRRSPEELATALGVPFYNAVGDPGVANSVPGVVVVYFPNATPTVSGNGFARTVSVSDPGGTLTGVNYTDPNGVVWADVEWEWQISVEGYADDAIIGESFTGRWDQQVLTYTGDGTVGRLIPTTFALNTGRVAIWIFPQTTNNFSFRHNDPLMLGTLCQNSAPDTAGGIMAFQSGGFTVTDLVAQLLHVNTLGQSYTAVVLRDTTSDFHYMTLGKYAGISVLGPGSMSFTLGSSTVVGGITPADVGRSFSVDGAGSYGIGSYIDASHFTYNDGGIPPFQLNGAHTVFSAASDRYIPTLAVGPATQLWIFGRGGQAAFGADDFTPPNSTSFGVEAKSQTNQILGISATPTTTFQVGTDNNVNNSGINYYWVAFAIPVGDALRALFATFTAAGTGGVVAVPFAFTPGFATARQFTTGTPTSVWRGPLHTGTVSTSFSGSSNASTGIRALDVASLDLGTAVCPAAGSAYGFALAASGSVVGGAPPAGCPLITIPELTLPNVPVGLAIVPLTIAATGGASPYTYAVVSGALPAGLTLSSAGVISGTPTTAGTYAFLIQATDTNGCLGGRAYTGMIVVASGTCPTIAVAPSHLPAPTVGQAYSRTLLASGGAPPYSFGVISGALPTGLTLSSAGVLAGTATVEGEVILFTVRATDTSGCFGERIYSSADGTFPSPRPPGPTTGCSSTVTPGAGPDPATVGCSATIAPGAGPTAGGTGCPVTMEVAP